MSEEPSKKAATKRNLNESFLLGLGSIIVVVLAAKGQWLNSIMGLILIQMFPE